MSEPELSRRERQIMDLVYRFEEATAEQIRAHLPNAPGNASVRVMLRILEEKGFLQHRREGRRFVYHPTIPAEQASTSATKRLIETFFEGSMSKAVVAMLSMSSSELSQEELDALVQSINNAQQERES